VGVGHQELGESRVHKNSAEDEAAIQMIARRRLSGLDCIISSSCQFSVLGSEEMGFDSFARLVILSVADLPDYHFASCWLD